MLQEFTQGIEDTARAVINDIHTAMPGEIISFDAASGVASVKPVGKFVTADGKKLDYPIITEVPVVFPFCQQAGVGMAFPVSRGDSCIVIISEVELDAWRSGAESESSLRFDLTSAMAIPGLLEGGSDLAVKAAEKNAAVLGASGVAVIVSDENVRVETGGAAFEISDSGVSIDGDLKVRGSIFYTADCLPG